MSLKETGANNIFWEIQVAIGVEVQKVKRSRTLWMTALIFLLLTLIGGLFMFILKDPELARSMGLIGTKAQLFGGTADWPGFLNLMLLLASIGSLVIFGFIFIWIFGREFGDRTVYDMLSLPTSRFTIVTAKIITAAGLSMALVLGVFILSMGVGFVLQLPQWSAATAVHGLSDMLVTAILTVIICITFALIASVTRGYLSAVGAIFLVLLLGQVLGRLGYGQYFPWTIPMLYSGAADALSGGTPAPIGFISYLLVGAAGLFSYVLIAAWWRYADQT